MIKTATVMFLDIKGFTALSREVGPETAYFAVGGLMEIVERVARHHGAAVDRYLGDALMAVFGHPLPTPWPERSALEAALEIRRRVADYDAGLPFASPLEVVVGINTGEIVAGDVRGKVVREFHVLGDVVNVSARLKARAERGTILVGGATRAAVGESFAFTALGHLPLKGKKAPAEVFELLDAREERWRREVGPRGGIATPFVGRAAELAVLHGALEKLAAGNGNVLALAGEAGIGKSRLLAEAVAHASGFEVLELRGGLDALPGGVEALERHANRVPLLLALEEADGLDPRLAALALRLPILVVLVSRAPFALELPDAARIRLGPLDEADAHALIAALEVDPALAPLVARRGAGNPRQLVLAAHLGAALHSEHERRGGAQPKDTERRRSTILFADLTGFTSLTEQLGAERAYPIIAGCLRMLDEIATKHGGAVEKYLGDCVMALFGVAEAMEDAPRAALNAAIEMRRSVRAYSAQVGAPLDVHSGVNVGLGIAGDVSGSMLREFTVMGDPVDVADALKDHAPSGRIYVGEEVRRATSEVFQFEPREPLSLKGIREPVRSFELTSEHERLHRARVGGERQVFSALVGRDAELAALRASLRALHEGRGGIVSICAEAGLGKSRLLAEIERTPEAQGLRWLLGRSRSVGSRLGFHTFADLVRSWSGIGERDEPAVARAKLREGLERGYPDGAEEALPFISRLVGVPVEPDEQERLDALPRDALEKRVLRHVAELLRAGSLRLPLVVVMDDLHWADASSVELLATVLPECRERRILFVNLFRPGFAETSERIRALAASPELADLHTELVLRPLPARATRDLLGNLFGEGGLPHATRLLIEEKAKGNPFYVEEVVRALVDAGAVEAHGGRFRATDRIAVMEIPGSVHEVVQTRVDGLEREARRLLQIAAVIGQTFRLELLATVASDVADVEGGVARLLHAEFLTASDRAPGAEYAFKHPLIQEVTYDGLLKARREELHRGVGAAIERTLTDATAGYYGMLAFHFSKGGSLGRAEEFLIRAGEDAARAAASNEALHFFQEAAALYLRTHGEDADPAKRAALEAKVASALYHRGRFVDSVEHYDRALELLGDRLARGEREQMLGFVRDLANVLRRLYVPLRTRRPPADERQREIMALRYARAESTTYALPARHVFDGLRSLSLVQRFDPKSVPSSAMMYAGAASMFAFLAISFDASRRLAAEAQRLAEGAPGPERLYERAMNFTYRALAGDWSPEHEIDPDLVAESIRLGHLWAPTTYLGLLAEKRLCQGDFGGADRAIEQIAGVWKDFAYDLAKTNLHALRAIEAIARGEFAAGRVAATEYYEENPEDILHLLALGYRAKAEVLSGDLEAAEASLAQADAITRRSPRVPPFHASRVVGARLLLDVTRLEARPDGPDARELRASTGRSIRAALANAPRTAFSRAELFRLAGWAEWRLGHRRRALAMLKRSATSADALLAPAARARTLAKVAELLRDEPATTFGGLDARACAVEAARIAAELGFASSSERFLRA